LIGVCRASTLRLPGRVEGFVLKQFPWIVVVAAFCFATELPDATQAGSASCTRAGEREVFRAGDVVVVARRSRFTACGQPTGTRINLLGRAGRFKVQGRFLAYVRTIRGTSTTFVVHSVDVRGLDTGSPRTRSRDRAGEASATPALPISKSTGRARSHGSLATH
jgi:hypothetical protein